MKGPLNHPDWTTLYHLRIDTHGDLGSLNFKNPPSNPHVSLTVESLDRLATLNSSARVWSNSACIGPQHLAAGKTSLSGTWGKIHRPMWWWHIHGQCMQILWTNNKCQILYFEWSPQWLSQFLTVHLEVNMAHIFFDILFRLSIWQSVLSYYCGILSGIYSDILSGILSGIYSDILSGIYSDILSGIYSGILPGIPSDIFFGILSGIHSDILFWHPIRHSFWHSFWHLFQHSFFGIYSGNFYLASILTFSPTWHCWTSTASARSQWAVPTKIWSLQLGSSSAHWDLALAVEVRQCALELAAEVRQCPSTSGTRSWGPDGWTDGRKDEEALEVILIKSRGTHLAGGEKITN